MAMGQETTTEFWMARFDTPEILVPDLAQVALNSCSIEHQISVIGYTQGSSLTVLHWPETREGYQAPTVDDCAAAIKALRATLGGGTIRGIELGPGRLHAMIGLRIGGYNGDTYERTDGIRRYLPEGTSVKSANMVSARYKTGGSIESYGEPVAIIIGSSNARIAVHELAHRLMQHHYVIESSDYPTTLYKTKWANQ